MNKLLQTIAFTVIAAGMIGCTTGPGTTGVTKQQVGTVAGGAAGGLLGSQIGKGSGRTVAIIGGTILGALLGGAVGQYMDEQDKLNAEHAMTAVPIGQQANWTNSQGANYTVTPIREYRTSSGQFCRMGKTTVTINGQYKQADVTVCQRPDGSWYVAQ